MTLTPERTWRLTDRARGQLNGIGITLSQLFRLLEEPQVRMPGGQDGAIRINGFGLTAVICGEEVRSIHIDGADSWNWEEWAKERAVFGDGDVAGADQRVRRELPRQERRHRRRREQPEQPPIQTAHVLDRVHPALRAEITRQVDGDFSRLVIQSPTKVMVMPPKI